MILKSLKLHNIRSYLSEDVYFPSGSLLLSGDIGAGKSTILLAVEFALFGVIRGSVDGSALLRHDKNSGYVELSFALDGREILVHRSLRRNKSSIAQPAGYLVVNGVRTDLTPVEIKARVLDMLGYPKSLLAKSKSLIYRYTVYTPQEEMKSILFEDSSARLETLRRVFQIDSYRKIRDNASIVMNSMRERIAGLSARAEGFDEKKAQLRELQQKLGAATEGLDSLLPLVRDCQSRLASHRELLAAYELRIKELSMLKSDIAAAEASLKEKRQSLDFSVQEMDKASRQIRDCEFRLAKSADVSKEFSASLGALSHHLALLQREASKKPGLESEMAALDARLAAANDRISAARANLEYARRLEKNVVRSDTCPVCLQPVAERHKADFRVKVSSEFEAAEKVISEAENEKEGVQKQLTTSRERLNGLIEQQRRLAELSALHGQYSSLARELSISPHYDGSPYAISDVLGRLSSLSSSIREKAQLSSLLNEKKSYLSSIQERVSAMTVGIEETSKMLSSMRSRLQPFASVEGDYLNARSRFESLQQQEKELLVKKASFEKEAETLNLNISLFDRELAAIEDAKNLLDSLVKLKNWMGELFINLMDSIERNVMLRVYNEFNSLFQRWFGILVEDEAISARLDDSFAPVVEINGYEVSLENLSGGEKTSCALAYRLALNRVINDIISTVNTRDLLILDEPTDGFSSQQLDRVREVLEQLGLAQIIIVSHEQKVESFVENVVRIAKEQHVSRVIS